MDQDSKNFCTDDSFECPQGIDADERRLLLQKIVDGQATLSEERFFYSSMEDCAKCQCKNLCEQHLEIKTLLKKKLAPVPMPSGLIEKIKGKISGTL